MKIYSVGFSPIWPVGCCLIVAAESLQEAEAIAKDTIMHTDEFEVHEVDTSTSGVIVFLDGDY